MTYFYGLFPNFLQAVLQGIVAIFQKQLPCRGWWEGGIKFQEKTQGCYLGSDGSKLFTGS